MNKTAPLLSVADLRISIDSRQGPLPAVRGLDFWIGRGESVCLVGESGCGKSLTALALLGLLPSSAFQVAADAMTFDAQDLRRLSPREQQHLRGRRIGMIFQEPMTALNPVFTVGEQIAEAITSHLKLSPAQVKDRVLTLMSQVGIPEPKARFGAYPHQLSGGLRQRAMIAMALACDPDLLIADEPTTALDVTTQAQILRLLHRLRAERDLSLLLITHNLGIVAQVAQRVFIMYAGKIVEKSDVRALFRDPLHPYTRGLLASLPYDAPQGTKRLNSIKGNVPTLQTIPSGCAFHNRCPRVMEICPRVLPQATERPGGREVACHLFT